MTEKIRIELDDATAAGIDSVDKNLGKLETSADGVQSAMNQAADAVEKIGDGAAAIDRVGDAVDALGDGSSVGKIKDQFDDVATAAKKTESAIENLGDADDSVYDIVESLKDAKHWLEGVEDESGQVEKALAKIGDADAELSSLRQQFKALSDGLREARTNAGYLEKAVADIDSAATGLANVEAGLDGIGDEADQAAKQINKAASSANDLGKKSKDVGGVGLKLTEINQGLEIIKKGLQVTTMAIGSMAASGNPAAQSLLDSFTKLGEELTRIGDDPSVRNAMQSLADMVNQQVAPAVGKIPDLFADTSQWLAKIGTQAAEFTGFFPEGTSETLEEDQERLSEIADQQKEINEQARIAALVNGKSEEIAARAAADLELRNIAKLESERQLKDLLELEIEARQELADSGELSGKKLESSDRRLEVLQRRLAELPQIRADAESKAANEAAKAIEDETKKKTDAEKEYQDLIAKGEAAAKEEENARNKKVIDDAKAVMDQLAKMIQSAKAANGNNALDDARSNISPEQTRAQLVKQAKSAAREKYIAENSDKVDKEGNAFGNTTRERAENQRKADRQIALAERKAAQEAFRGFNDFASGRGEEIEARKAREAEGRRKRSGGKKTFDDIQRDPANMAPKLSQADIAGAQNALINEQAQAAVGRGELDQQTAQALMQAAQNQQNMIATQERQAQQLQQIQQALAGVGNAAQRNMGKASRQAGL